VSRRDPNSSGWFLSILRELARPLWQVGSLLALLVLLAPAAYLLDGPEGFAAAATAMLALLIASAFEHVFRERLRALLPVAGLVVLGMLVRMAVPLAFCMAVLKREGSLVESGFAYYLLVFYLVNLVTGTWLAVVDAHQQQPRPARNL